MEMISNLGDIAGTLAKGVAYANEHSELAPEVVDALASQRLFDMSTPRRFGGLQLDVLTQCRVISELAKSCGSAAWVVMIVNGCNSYGWRFPEEAQEEVFGQGPTRCAQVIAASASFTEHDDGYLLNGRWGFASGILHDDWVMLGNRDRIAIVPVDSIEIDRTWDMVGMRGSGSHTVVATNVFVPAYRTAPLSVIMGMDQCDDTTVPSYARYAPLPSSAATVASVLVGLAERACEIVAERSLTRAQLMGPHKVQSDSEAFRARLGECMVNIASARLLLETVAAATDEAAETATLLSPTTITNLAANVSRVARITTSTMDELMHLSGASAFANSNPLTQIWRDLNTGARHAALNPFTNEEAVGAAAVNAESVAPSRVQK
jgi:alkylation response protein AidB-like acyl-CoA dehydrogenase